MSSRCRIARSLAGLVALVVASAGVFAAPPGAARRPCLSDCTPRIGIVSAFGAEADLLVAQTRRARTRTINGNRITSGVLRGNRVAIVLSGVSMINSAMVTQLLIDHFRITRLVMSGISGGLNPEHHIGDVIVPERWAMPMEVYWNHDATPPSPCGPAGVACLGLKLASLDGKALPPLVLPGPNGEAVATGLFVRENIVMSRARAGRGEFKFDYAVDPEMLAVVRSLRPALSRCGPKATLDAAGVPDPSLCVRTQPRLVVGGRGVSGTAFVANPAYRAYLHDALQAQTVEMETAALAHVAYANGIPYIAFRSLSDLAGGEEFDADAGALFASGLAESNEAAVTLAFLDAWAERHPAPPTRHSRHRKGGR